MPNTRVPPPTLSLRWHVKDKHVKDAAQDVAEDVLGATEDRGLKEFIVARVIFQRRNPRPTHACHPSRLLLGDT